MAGHELNEEELALWHKIQQATERAVNTAYGTDPRHPMLGNAVADEVVQDIPFPWGVSKQFGAR